MEWIEVKNTDVVELNGQVEALREVVAAVFELYVDSNPVSIMLASRKLARSTIVTEGQSPPSVYGRIDDAIQHALDIGAL